MTRHSQGPAASRARVSGAYPPRVTCIDVLAGPLPVRNGHSVINRDVPAMVGAPILDQLGPSCLRPAAVPKSCSCLTDQLGLS